MMSPTTTGFVASAPHSLTPSTDRYHAGPSLATLARSISDVVALLVFERSWFALSHLVTVVFPGVVVPDLVDVHEETTKAIPSIKRATAILRFMASPFADV